MKTMLTCHTSQSCFHFSQLNVCEQTALCGFLKGFYSVASSERRMELHPLQIQVGKNRNMSLFSICLIIQKFNVIFAQWKRSVFRKHTYVDIANEQLERKLKYHGQESGTSGRRNLQPVIGKFGICLPLLQTPNEGHCWKPQRTFTNNLFRDPTHRENKLSYFRSRCI